LNFAVSLKRKASRAVEILRGMHARKRLQRRCAQILHNKLLIALADNMHDRLLAQRSFFATLSV
ncbi:MAG: hypothetical protein ACRD3K_03225, partial [Edaphobacter sp.]